MIDAIRERIFAKDAEIGVVGLGYVGLPLATLLAEKFRVCGFDVDRDRVQELGEGTDKKGEVTDSEKLKQKTLRFTCDGKDLARCSVIIVCVPTPVDRFKVPDLSPLERASKTIGAVAQPGTVVVYESTVYPGVTEGLCREILEKESGLTLGQDLFLGYSPERVNPGDRKHTIDKIAKVVAGSTPEVTDLLTDLYGAVVTAGIHRAANIKTAEAAKVIENTQRDLNIALINELSLIFERLDIDTADVLAAARTKWNFLDFRPGLVGGHCIGVDPYYLTHLATSIGYHPQVITAGRHINDGMGAFVAQKTLNMLLSGSPPPSGRPVCGILGVTFKEDVPDLRNSKVIDVATGLERSGCEVHFVDPIADAKEFEDEYGRALSTWDEMPRCDALVIAVQHKIFREEFPMDRLIEKLSDCRVIVDVKGGLDRAVAEKLGLRLWRL